MVQAFAPGNCDLASGDLTSDVEKAKVAALIVALVELARKLKA